MIKATIRSALLAIMLTLTACSSTASDMPSDTQNACLMITEQKGWWKALKTAQKQWGTPPHIILAFIHQESGFRAKAVPKRVYRFGIIPGGRPSSAYGYAQALDTTWNEYRDRTGNKRARRSDFADSVDFIAWYINRSSVTLKLSKWDAYNQYLAYHEGRGGYKRKTYLKKRWLVDVAIKVNRQADRYADQLWACSKRLDRSFL